jgi:hypothetical protein
MKKIILLLAAASIALGASAQLRVANSGQVHVGAVIPETSTANSDTVATLRILGPGTDYSGGRISFGKGEVSIEHSQASKLLTSGSSLIFRTGSGFSFLCGINSILSYNNSLSVSGSTPALTSSVKVSAPQFLTTSDARSKTNIEPLENMGELLRNIAPVSYTLVGNAEGDAETDVNGPKKSKARSAQHQYGFLAQDVREVYPELVYEDSEGMLSIDYTGFIAILVDAVQNLQGQVKEQAETIEALKNGTKEGGSVPDGSVVASLSQNRPNPFRTSTVVSCVLPDDVSSAFLCVYDLNGNQKLRNNITERGNVDITIEGNTLTAGMYIYTLIADGVEIDSKRMILTD